MTRVEDLTGKSGGSVPGFFLGLSFGSDSRPSEERSEKHCGKRSTTVTPTRSCSSAIFLAKHGAKRRPNASGRREEFFEFPGKLGFFKAATTSGPRGGKGRGYVCEGRTLSADSVAARFFVPCPTAGRADVDASDAGKEPSPGDLNMVCEHLFEAMPIPARTPGCEECLKTGLRWVHLRLCLSCGHVGCCDGSPGRHATKHFHQTSHPWSRPSSPARVGPGATWIRRNCPCRPRPSSICASGFSCSSPYESREARRA